MLHVTCDWTSLSSVGLGDSVAVTSVDDIVMLSVVRLVVLLLISSTVLLGFERVYMWCCGLVVLLGVWLGVFCILVVVRTSATNCLQ